MNGAYLWRANVRDGESQSCWSLKHSLSMLTFCPYLSFGRMLQRANAKEVTKFTMASISYLLMEHACLLCRLTQRRSENPLLVTLCLWKHGYYDMNGANLQSPNMVDGKIDNFIHLKNSHWASTPFVQAYIDGVKSSLFDDAITATNDPNAAALQRTCEKITNALISHFLI